MQLDVVREPDPSWRTRAQQLRYDFYSAMLEVVKEEYKVDGVEQMEWEIFKQLRMFQHGISIEEWKDDFEIY